MKTEPMALWLLLPVLLCGCAKQTTLTPGPDAGSGLPDKTAGKNCQRDDDCPNGRCADALHITAANTAIDAPGGYCTMDCDTDALCGATGECAVPAGEAAGECLGRCNDAAPCRDGYICVGAGRALGASLSGTCQPKPATGQLSDGAVGRECSSVADCKGGACARSSPLGPDFPGSYCTARCFDDAQCGSGGACLVNSGSSEAGYCFAHCGSDDDCTRDGYRCRHIGLNFDACYPAQRAFPDNTAGHACSVDADCGGAQGSCAAELPFGDLSANTIAAAPGGYCTQPCSLDVDCGTNAQCIAAGIQGGMCLGSCKAMDDCRDGYTCIAHERNLNDTDKVCVPLLQR